MTKRWTGWVLVLAILVPAGAWAGTWADDFEDQQLGAGWTVTDLTGEAVPPGSLVETGGVVQLPLDPGKGFVLSPGSFDGDLSFQADFSPAQAGAIGSIGLVLAQPARDNTPEVVISALMESTAGGQLRYVVTAAPNPPITQACTAVTDFILQIVRAGNQVKVTYSEDGAAAKDLAGPLTFPSGPTQVRVMAFATQQAKAWQGQLRDFQLVGPNVPEGVRGITGGTLAKAKPQPKPFAISRASLYANKGFRLLRDKRWDEAVQAYENACLLDPSGKYTRVRNVTRRVANMAKSMPAEKLGKQKILGGMTVAAWLGWPPPGAAKK